jgi:cellulose 1,4-beta-cellobiosidase
MTLGVQYISSDVPPATIAHHTYSKLFTMYRNLVLAASFLSVARSQLVGTQQTETHPGMTWQNCSAKGSCTTKNGKVVIDANWRWLHKKTGYV